MSNKMITINVYLSNGDDELIQVMGFDSFEELVDEILKKRAIRVNDDKYIVVNQIAKFEFFNEITLKGENNNEN